MYLILTMKKLDLTPLCVWYLLLCCLGKLHVHGQRRFNIPSVSDLLSDAMSLERAAANFDRSANLENQPNTASSDSGTDSQVDQAASPFDQQLGLQPGTVGQQGGVPEVLGPAVSAANPFPGQEPTGMGPEVGPPLNPVLDGNVHLLPPGAHIDLPRQHGNHNDFAVVHVGSDPISGDKHSHTQAVPSHTTPHDSHTHDTPSQNNNLGPSMVDIININTGDFHGASVHQTAPEFVDSNRGSIDLGSTIQDPSSIFPNFGSQPGISGQLPVMPGGSAFPANPIDVPLGPAPPPDLGPVVLGAVPTDVFESDVATDPFGNSGLPANPIGVPTDIFAPLDPNLNNVGAVPDLGPGSTVLGAVPTDLFGPGIATDPFGNVPSSNVPIDVNTPHRGGSPAVNAPDSHAIDHSHQGLHFDGTGQHGNTLSEPALRIPEGMTMEEARSSGILDAIAHDRALRQNMSSAANPPQPLPGRIPGRPSVVVPATPVLHTDVHHGGPPTVNIPVQPAGPPVVGIGGAPPAHNQPHDHSHQGLPFDGTGQQGNTLSETALRIPEGMTMEEARSSGILDAIAHDRAMQGNAPQSANPPQPLPGHIPGQPSSGVPATPFGFGGAVPSVPFGSSMPVGPVEPLGLPAGRELTRSERRERRRNRRRRLRNRNRNGRRGREREGRPALDPINVAIPADPGHVHPTHVERPVQPPPTPHVHPGHAHPTHGNVALTPGVSGTGVLGGRPMSLFPGGGGIVSQGPGFPGMPGFPGLPPPGPHHHRNVAIVPGYPRGRGPPRTGGGLLGEVMRTAVQIGSGSPLNSPPGIGGLFRNGPQNQHRGGHNNPVQVTRTGPIGVASTNQQPAVIVRGGVFNPLGQLRQLVRGQNNGQNNDPLKSLQDSLGNTIFNMLGNMVG